jgi:circadian clock protein KaiB
MNATSMKPLASSVMFKFRLYVMGDTQNSMEAVANLTALCDSHMRDQHEIEFVDVSLHPERALTDGIFMTPTLIKLAPSPTRMIVGTLRNAEPVMQALGLNAVTSNSPNSQTRLVAPSYSLQVE